MNKYTGPNGYAPPLPPADMSLRTYVAALALQGLVANREYDAGVVHAVHDAFAYADEFLRQGGL